VDLDIEQPQALIAYLHQSGYLPAHVIPRVHRLDGGVSNRTMLVELPGGDAWVLKQALEKLRVPVDWFSSPERVHREAAGLRWLTRLAPPGAIPGFVFEDQDHHILAMQRVPQPHVNWKRMLLDGQLYHRHIEQFARLLGTIHWQAYQRRSEVAPDFEDRSFFESLRLEPYYQYCAAQIPETAPFFQALIDDTLRQRVTLVHGDYSPKNILVFQDRLILLDHEVIHFGDPAFDLGFSLTHLLSKAHYVSGRRAEFADAARQYWQIYGRTIGNVIWATDLEDRTVRHTLGCLLARAAGRSQLEYLSAEQRQRQRETVVSLMNHPPATIPELVDRFVTGLV
jgi:5-methylthioribose kinase